MLETLHTGRRGLRLVVAIYINIDPEPEWPLRGEQRVHTQLRTPYAKPRLRLLVDVYGGDLVEAKFEQFLEIGTSASLAMQRDDTRDDVAQALGLEQVVRRE